MRRILSITVLLLITILFTFGNGQEKFESLGKSSQKFAANIYKKLSLKPGNILTSPISVQTVLALIQLGAKGRTLREISQTTFLPLNKVVLIRSFRKMHRQLLRRTNISVDLANKIYLTDRIRLQNKYQNVAKMLQVEIEQINLTNKTAAVAEINEWVRWKTNDKINQIVSDNDISNGTTMVLLNGLYYYGNWLNVFSEELIQKRKFYIDEVNEILLDMMIQINDFNYTDHDGLKAKFLELPYAGGDFVMTLVLPYEQNGLPQLEARIDEILQPQQMQVHETTVILPKFKIEKEIRFNGILQELGMKTAFQLANLTSMTADNILLNIDEVIQKSFIEVNEKGTEAAAATGISFENRFGRNDRKHFAATHPFLFLIKQKSTDIVHFLGRFVGS